MYHKYNGNVVLGSSWIPSITIQRLSYWQTRLLRNSSPTKVVYGKTCRHLTKKCCGNNVWSCCSRNGKPRQKKMGYLGTIVVLRALATRRYILLLWRKLFKLLLHNGTLLLFFGLWLQPTSGRMTWAMESRNSYCNILVKNTGYEALEEALIRERLQQKTNLDNLEKRGNSGTSNNNNTAPTPSEKRFQNMAEVEKSDLKPNNNHNNNDTKEESTSETLPYHSPNASSNNNNNNNMGNTSQDKSSRASESSQQSSLTTEKRIFQEPWSIDSIKLWLAQCRQRLGDTLDNIREAHLLEDSGLLSHLRLPTQRETFAILSQFTLVCALILLLRAGVNRTLRWVYSRFDPNAHQISYEQSVFECMQRPLEFLAVSTVIISVAEFVSRPLAATGLLKYIRPLRELTVIFSATWFLLRWIERIRSRFIDSSTYEARVNKAQVDALSRVMTVVVSAIALLISLDTFGINIQTVLAFGGIGGVAIGFAGREIISNFFGGFMIYLTQPFAVGDWVRSIENDQIDGSVEEIGWYLTRIRTWEKRPLYIPNSRFSTLVMENPSRMTNRRIKHTIGLAMEDMCVIKDIIRDIQTLLDGHPELDPKQHRMVWFDGFGEYSVNLWLSCYTKTVFLSEYRRVQQEILFAVYDIIRSHHGRLACSLIRDLREGSNPDKYAPIVQSSESFSSANNNNNYGTSTPTTTNASYPPNGTNHVIVQDWNNNNSNKSDTAATTSIVTSSTEEKSSTKTSSQSGTMRIKGPGRTSSNPSSTTTNNNNNNNNNTSYSSSSNTTTTTTSNNNNSETI